MGTIHYTSSLLSFKLHEGDKAAVTVKKKKEIDAKTVFRELCLESRDGLDKAASLKGLQLWLTACSTAVIVTTKRNC